MSKMPVIFTAILGILVSVCTLNAGWVYTAVTRGEGSDQAQAANSTVKGWIDGNKARIEIAESANPMIPQQSYLISSDGGHTLFLVNPPERTYTRWDINAIIGLAGGAMQMMGMSFTTPNVEKLVDEPGPSLLGFSTRHYRFLTSYALNMNFLGMRKSTEFKQEEDIWATDQLKDAGFNAWLNQRPNKTGNAEFDKLIEAELSKIRGFPLKRISVTTQKDNDGNMETIKTTMEITSLSKADIPPGFFELPQDYTEKPLMPSLKGSGQENGDSTIPKESDPQEQNPFLKFLEQMQKGK